MRPAVVGVAVVGCIVALLLAARDGQGQGRRRGFDGRGTPPLSVSDVLPGGPTAPAHNPTTPEKVALGRLLFWDPMLSGPQDVACATCHHPRFGYAEDRDISIGINGFGLGRGRRFAPEQTPTFVKRNSQTILNTAFNGIGPGGAQNPDRAPMFWDLRTESLETQALVPLRTHEEMRGSAYDEADAVRQVVVRLQANQEYRRLFARAFADDPVANEGNLGRALAAFERSLTATNAPFDRYMRGDPSAMTPAQVRGMRRFERIGCGNCHKGPMFSDYLPHVLGVPDNNQLPASDPGREGGPRYGFRTASLRNLTLTAPYMHSGVFASLEEVLEFYDDVDDRENDARNSHVGRDELDPLLRRLRGVDDDDTDLIAFLHALTDETYDRTIPARVPSGLAPGGRIR